MANCIGVWQKEISLDHNQGQGAGVLKFTEFANNGPKNINVQTVLTRVGTYNNNSSTKVYIHSYVSNGVTHPGNAAAVMYIPNATEVTVMVDLVEGYVTAAAMVFVWG